MFNGPGREKVIFHLFRGLKLNDIREVLEKTVSVLIKMTNFVLVPSPTESIHQRFNNDLQEIDLGNAKKILTGVKVYEDPISYRSIEQIKIYVYSRVGFNDYDYVDYEDIILDWKKVRQIVDIYCFAMIPKTLFNVRKYIESSNK